MKIITLFLFVSLSFLSYSFKDSLKTKKLDFLIETGIGFNTNVLYGEDSLSILTNSKRKKIGIGIIYNFSREWKLYANVEYYQLKINQLVLTDLSNYPFIFKHKLNILHFTASLYHCLIHDDKSTLYIGLGFGTSYHLKTEEKSNIITKKNGDNYDAYQIVTRPKNIGLKANVDLGLLYEYDFDNIDVGFKIDFTSYGGYWVPYTYELNGSALHSGNISPNNFNIETSIFVKF